jgi:cellulose synthase operon protein C
MRLGAFLSAVTLAIAAPGAADPAGLAGETVAGARMALIRRDGIDAEMRLQRAMSQGVPREAIAALMGEAMLLQNRRAKAREWLAPQAFSPDTASLGFRALAMLERKDGNLAAAGRAFNRAIALTPRDATMWVEIADLRYAGGEHLLAIEAADYALALEPANVRALVYRGMLVRDRYGPGASLPWFEKALSLAPKDREGLGQYAASLGEMGRAREALVVTRRMIALDPKSAQAFYLQAVMAARAGNTELARRLLTRGGKSLANLPGAMLLDATLQLASGNTAAAIRILERLAKRQPGNERVRMLLARALYQAGNHQDLVMRFGPAADKPDASPYLMLLLARSHERAGRRDLAAPLLDRAWREFARPMGVVVDGIAPSSPKIAGNAAVQEYTGDQALIARDAKEALENYRAAARVRQSESMVMRQAVAFEVAGQGGEAADLVQGYLVQNPGSRVAVRLSAAVAAKRGDWVRAARLYGFLSRNGGQRDVRVQLDLANAQTRAGNRVAASEAAWQAHRLMRGSGYVAEVLGQALPSGQSQVAVINGLLQKAGRMQTRYQMLPPVRYAF